MKRQQLGWLALAFTLAACGRSSTPALSVTDDAQALFSAAQQATVAPSVSSVPAANSVAPGAEELPSMASNEVLDAVTMHLQSILTRLQGVDPSQLPPRLSQALGPITERLSQRLQQLETDPAMQQKVVDLVTRLKNRPFPGRYEGLKTRIQGRVAANPERLCQLLQRVLESGRIQNESIRSKVQSKYQSDCLNEALPL